MLKHCSSALNEVTKRLSGDKTIRLLTAHWSELAGAHYAHRSRVDSLTSHQNRHTSGKRLTLSVTASIAPDIDYDKDSIRRRINQFLAQDLITDIRIRQTLPEPNTQPLEENNSSPAEINITPVIPDNVSPSLRKSLKALAQAVAKSSSSS